MTLIQKAERIARAAHAGQFRRDGTTPYITHPERVAKALKAEGYNEAVVAAGWLHDVIEDTDWTIEDLTIEQFPEEVLDAVQLLSFEPDMTYWRYLEFICGDQIARAVKLADIRDNLNDDPSAKQALKYARALDYLNSH